MNALTRYVARMGIRQRVMRTTTWTIQWRNIRQLTYFTHHIFSQFSVFCTYIHRNMSHSLSLSSPVCVCVSLGRFIFFLFMFSCSRALVFRFCLRSGFCGGDLALKHEPFPFPLPMIHLVSGCATTHIGISQISYEKLFIARFLSLLTLTLVPRFGTRACLCMLAHLEFPVQH